MCVTSVDNCRESASSDLQMGDVLPSDCQSPLCLCCFNQWCERERCATVFGGVLDVELCGVRNTSESVMPDCGLWS